MSTQDGNPDATGPAKGAEKGAEEPAGFEAELEARLRAEGDVGKIELEWARKEQADRGVGLTTALIDLGLVAEDRLRELRAAILGPPREPDDAELISQGSFQRIYESGASALPPTGRTAPLRPGEARAPVERELAPLTPEEPSTEAKPTFSTKRHGRPTGSGPKLSRRR